MNEIRKTARLSSYDLMVIRAGGQSEFEKQELINRVGSSQSICAVYGHLADLVYRIVGWLERGAQRSIENSHLRFARKYNMNGSA